MTLSAGTRLGPYDIVAKLGEGGMGEVYRARDTRLGRDVAIKVLPSSFAGDADRRVRFEREAQAVAALSHPNVVAIHDTGTHDGQLYLVMELLQGETLRDRLKNGALATRKAIDIAVHIARGLAAAHARGLVHRDLKPENVFLIADGQVKVLDFGLARATGTGSGATETVPVVTDPGTVMGTVGYMAPEQVRGQPVDARADLFALGAVLYEMLTGRRAFRRDTPAETMTSILNDEPPDPGSLRAGLSPALDHIVRHSLEKNPAERFQSARDVAFALESLSGSGATIALQGIPARRLWWARGAAIAGIALAMVAGAWIGRRTSTGSDPVFDVKTWDRETIFNARFLPDGAIAYSAAHIGMTPELFELHPDRAAPERLAGPSTHLLSVSSKGELAVLTNAEFIEHRLFRGTLARLTLGASPRPWRDDVREADWSPDGSTLAVITRAAGQQHDRLEYPIGTELYASDGYLSDVRVSHDGRRVAFADHRGDWDDRGWVKVVDAKKQVLTLTDEYLGIEGVAWAPDDGQIFYSAVAASTPGLQLYAVSSTRPQSARTALRMPGDAIVFDVNPDGRWLVSREDTRWGIVVKKPGDAVEQEMSYLNLSNNGELSPDGSELLFGSQHPSDGLDYALMLRRTDGSPPVRLGDGLKMPGSLSPDGHWAVAFLPSAGNFVAYPVGVGTPVRFATSPDVEYGGWFSDSQHLMLMMSVKAAPLRCYRQAITGAAPEPIGPDDADFCLPLPDGKLLAHTRDDKMVLYDPRKGVSTPTYAPGAFPLMYEPEDSAIVWAQTPNQTLRIDRVNLQTKAIAPVMTIAIPDRAGLVKLKASSFIGTPGRYGYSYGYTRELSTLLLVSGVKMH